MLSTILVLAGLANAVAVYTTEAQADQIRNLPGTEKLDVNFNQFSGYLNISGASGNSKHMHYWFVESLNHPSTDPLAFWTNGGPGCSGLIGFMTEQGPFKPNEDLSLSLNPYAWNKVANMVFIESPASVGFSYSDEAADKSTGDAQTALDNYNLIQAFLVRFPEYKSNPLYISSESYGGHYMPTLAKHIVDANKAGGSALNFKGFAVGNPYTDVYSGTPAMIDTYWGHQLIAKPTYDAYQADCIKAVRPNVRECAQLEMEMMNGVGDLNSYALDYPICTTEGASAAKKGRAQRLWFLNSLLKSKASAEERKLMAVTAEPASYEPCADDWGMQYLNQASVKRAIHVKESIPWMQCSYTLDYNMTDSSVSTAPIYNYLIDSDAALNILVYSGDDDSVCGTVGTQAWIWDLGYNVSGKPWQTYEYNHQTAGYLTKWKNTGLAFTTIHGAGHEVPTYKPDVALDMWTKYLNGEFTSRE
jgi:carboxypeptidase C (cathepsin A)